MDQLPKDFASFTRRRAPDERGFAVLKIGCTLCKIYLAINSARIIADAFLARNHGTSTPLVLK